VLEIGKRPDPGQLPRKVGRYLYVEPIGSGSSCEAFLAVTGAVGLERLCVVRRVRPDLVRDEAYVARFLTEARALATASHGSIAQVLDVGRAEDGVPFLASELVEGRDLARTIEAGAGAGRRVSLEVALHVVSEILDGLHHAATRRDTEGAPLRLRHGGLSPASVVLSWDGHAKIVDLGMARARLRSEALSAYPSPEEARGEDVDARADVFAAGVLLWETICGERLVKGDVTRHHEALRSGRFVAPPLSGRVPRASPDVDRIIARATAATPADRFADAALFRSALTDVLHRVASGTGPAHVAQMLEHTFPQGRASDAARHVQLLGLGRSRSAETVAAPSPTTGPLAAAPDHVPGTRYRIVAKLGEGGAGTVYDAIHVDLERRVALKILHAEASARADFVERFRGEARAVARLGHENIIAATDFGQTADGRVFFAMERLDGESLAERIGGKGALDVGESLRISEQVLRGLGAAHAVGIVHRDIKPENVFLTADGKVKLLDFGIAKAFGEGATAPKLTREGIALGTPEYMAPEQAMAADVDARTDVYAVGVVLYEMLTGSLPFEAEAVPKLLVKHMEEAPERPSLRAPLRKIPSDVEKIVLRALEKDPAGRFQTAAEMAAALEEILDTSQTPLEVPAAARRPASSDAFPAESTRPAIPSAVADAARRSSTAPSRAPRAALAVIIGLVLGLALWLGIRQDRPDRPGRDEPQGRGRRILVEGDSPRSSSPAAEASSLPAPVPLPDTAASATSVPASAAPEPDADELLAQADAAYAAHRYTDAEALVLRAKAAGARGREWRIRIAEIAFKRGNLSLARQEVATLLLRNPNYGRAVRLAEQLGER